MALFNDPLTKALADVAKGIMEEQDLIEAKLSDVAKELSAYAKADGGIDKNDMLKAADMMAKNKERELVKFVNDLDTEPRELIIMMVAGELGTKAAEKMFKVNLRASKELPEEILDDDASDFVVAAAAAKRAGKKKFKFGGKEYPVTIKTDIKTEEVELDEAVVIDYDGGLDADDPDLKKLLKQLRAKLKVTGTDPNGFDEVKITFPNDAAVKKFIKITGIDILDEGLDEAQGPHAKAWMKGAKNIKVGKIELVRGKDVHKIKVGGKDFGDFSLDDEAMLWVANMKGMKGQWTGNSVDDLIKHIQKAHLGEDFTPCEGCKTEEKCMAESQCQAKTEEKDLSEGFTKDDIAKAVKIADKNSGNMTGAVRAIEMIKRGLSKVKEVQSALRLANEELEEAKSNYEVKHKTFSSAIQHAVEVAAKQGYDVDPDDYDRKVAMGPKKPSKGKTNSYSIKLTKNGKEQKKALQVQIANLDDKFYELNMYIQ